MTPTENTAEIVAALTRELAGYERYGREDRAAEVRKQLAALGAKGEPPAKRASKRAPKSAQERG